VDPAGRRRRHREPPFSGRGASPLKTLSRIGDDSDISQRFDWKKPGGGGGEHLPTSVGKTATRSPKEKLLAISVRDRWIFLRKGRGFNGE
jgi:hypothetical protein